MPVCCGRYGTAAVPMRDPAKWIVAEWVIKVPGLKAKQWHQACAIRALGIAKLFHDLVALKKCKHSAETLYLRDSPTP